MKNRREQRSYPAMAGAVLVAAAFWFAVTMGESFVARVNVPLRVVNMPEGVSLASELPREIEISLEGNGWQLIFLNVSKQLAFEIPGSGVRSGRAILTNRILQEALRLPSGIRAIRAYPDTLFVLTDAVAEKKVPIIPDYAALTFKAGFGLTEAVRMTPDSVVLRGAKSVLERISSWGTEPLAYQDLSLPVNDQVALKDSLSGIVRIYPSGVLISIPVQQHADVAYENIPVRLENVPPHSDILLLNSTVVIHVRGGVNTLADLDADRFSAVIDYDDVARDTSGVVIPRILLPEGVSLLSIEPPEIRYTVRQK